MIYWLVFLDIPLKMACENSRINQGYYLVYPPTIIISSLIFPLNMVDLSIGNSLPEGNPLLGGSSHLVSEL